MSKTRHAFDLADYLLNEGQEDGAMIGISDAKLCASALKLYARLRRGAACLLVASVPATAVPLMGFEAIAIPSMATATAYSVADPSFDLRAVTPCAGIGTASIKPM